MPALTIISSIYGNNFLKLNCSHSQFTEGETEAQGGEVTCFGCTDGKWQSWDENPDFTPEPLSPMWG